MSSDAFNQLKNELSCLSIGLLPSENEKLDITYDESIWREKVKGYIVLSHAAFENYLEQLAIEIIKKAYDHYLITNQPNNLLLSLILSYKIHWPPLENDCIDCFWRKHIIKCNGRRKNIKIKLKEKSFKKMIKDVIYDYYKKGVIDENHGVREKHIEAIFSPLGYNINLLDVTFKNDLDRFCTLRGILAHTTTVSGTTTLLSPDEAKVLTRKLLGGNKNIWGFEDFDAQIITLL